MRQSLSGRYGVTLADSNGDLLLSLANVITFQYVKSLNSPGAFFIRLAPEDYRSLDYWRKDRLLVFRRAAPGGTNRIDFKGFVRRIEGYQQNSRSIVTVVGEGPLGLLKRRFIRNSVTVTGPADDVMKHLVRNEIGAATTDDARQLEALVVVEDKGQAPTITVDVESENLLTACQNIAKMSAENGTPLFFGMSWSSDGTLLFDTATEFFGIDRTQTGSTLYASAGQLNDTTFSQDYTNEYNAVLVVGGNGVEGEYVATARATETQWSRVEEVFNYAGIDSEADAVEMAQAEARRGKQVISADARLVPTRGALYGKDYELGDRLWISFEGFRRAVVITSISATVTPDGKEALEVDLYE